MTNIKTECALNTEYNRIEGICSLYVQQRIPSRLSRINYSRFNWKADFRKKNNLILQLQVDCPVTLDSMYWVKTEELSHFRRFNLW